MTKTLKQLINEKGEAAIFDNIVDEATQSELVDYFYFRYVNDDKKFIHFFQRNMRIYYKQYVNYLRVENTQFDPMVTRYLERQLVSKVKSTDNSNIKEQGVENKNVVDGGSSTRKTDNISTGNAESNSQGNSQYNSQKNGSHNEHTDAHDNSQDRSRAITSVFPQANVNAQTSGRLGDPVSYKYATNMVDTQNDHNGSNNSQVNGANSEAENGNNVSNEKVNAKNRDVLDGKETITRNNTQDTQKNNNIDKTINNTGDELTNTKERFTGRENYDAATLLSHARDYIATTNAFMWYVSQLSKCFIGNFRYGEDEEDV